MIGFSDFAYNQSKGDTFTFQFTVKNRQTGVVVDITSWTAFRYTAKRSVGETDAEATFSLSLAAGLGKTDAVNGVVGGTVTPANTSGLDWLDYDLKADFQGVDGSGNTWTLARGIHSVAADVGRTSP